jgi:plastocyanin
MIRITISIIFFILINLGSLAQTTHTIGVSGFTFNPDVITISIGDTVFFNGNSEHPILEVSKDSWDENDDTQISGGFSFPSGVGKISFDEGDSHYYICDNHVSSGMKGQITVSETTSSKLMEPEFIKVYPNPLNENYLNVFLSNVAKSGFNLVIYDITGRVKDSEIISVSDDIIKVDCSNLVSGLHILQLQNNKTRITSRFIKN